MPLWDALNTQVCERNGASRWLCRTTDIKYITTGEIIVRHPFYDFIQQMVLGVIVGLVGLQVCLMLEFYILASIVGMSMVLFGMGTTFGYMHRKRR